MNRRDDNEEPEIDCPVCRRSFHSFARLEDHMDEHEGLRQCKNCGKQLQPKEYHKC